MPRGCEEKLRGTQFILWEVTILSHLLLHIYKLPISPGSCLKRTLPRQFPNAAASYHA